MKRVEARHVPSMHVFRCNLCELVYISVHLYELLLHERVGRWRLTHGDGFHVQKRQLV